MGQVDTQCPFPPQYKHKFNRQQPFHSSMVGVVLPSCIGSGTGSGILVSSEGNIREGGDSDGVGGDLNPWLSTTRNGELTCVLRWRACIR